MTTKLVFLGTGGMVPTKERNVQSLYLEHNGEGILLDCGEGTQRQLSLAGISAQKISTILISHWHGDHVIGLIGLIQTINAFAPEHKEIHIYGPAGSKTYFFHMMQSTVFTPTISLTVHELDVPHLTMFLQRDDYLLQAINLDHQTPCLGFRFEKKERRTIKKEQLPPGIPGPLIGKLQQGETITFNGETLFADDVSLIQPAEGISFIFDTKLCDACQELAQQSSVLISEAVYTHDLLEKAEEYHHLTARQVGQLAKDCGVDHLILTHFSQRYKDVEVLAQDARDVFAQVVCAEDFLEIEFDF